MEGTHADGEVVIRPFEARLSAGHLRVRGMDDIDSLS
jgi:hypothetical protein